jgi:Phage gp6-like head-tail connector protein
VPVVNGYASLNDLKSALRIQDGVDDSLLEIALESASRLIDEYTMRSFYNAGTATRVFVPSDDDCVPIDDAVSISSIAVSTLMNKTFDQTWATTEYQTEPLNGIVDGLSGWPITRIRSIGIYEFPYDDDDEVATVQITGVWGWSAVPTAVKQATIIQAMRIFKRLDSPLGVISSPDTGYFRVSSRIDPDVAMLLNSYRKTRHLG